MGQLARLWLSVDILTTGLRGERQGGQKPIFGKGWSTFEQGYTPADEESANLGDPLHQMVEEEENPIGLVEAPILKTYELTLLKREYATAAPVPKSYLDETE